MVDLQSMFDRYTVDRTVLLNAMCEAKAIRAIVEFSGGNDEGGADSITIIHEDDSETNPDTYGDDPLAALLSRLPSEKYYSFAGDFDVTGTVTVCRNATDMSVTISGSERAEYTNFEETL